MKRSVLFYVATTVALYLSATVVVALVCGTPTPADWKAAFWFAFIGFFATLLSYNKGGGVASGTVSFLPFLSGVLVSPSAAVTVSVFGGAFAAGLLQKKPFAKGLFNSAQFGVATAGAALVLQRDVALSTIWWSPTNAIRFCAAALVFMAINHVLVVGVICLAERRLFWPTFKRAVRATILYDVLAFPVIALLAWAYTEHGTAWLFAIVLPLLCLRQLYKKTAELEKVTEEMLQLMVSYMETHDEYTSGHSRRVAFYSRIIAKSARIPSRIVDRIGVAALLHDVGKIHEVYAPILRKPGRLTAEEQLVIQTHPAKSAELVGKVTQLRDVVPAVRAHHERWDGQGYPDKLAGDLIPLGARVIALADTIDAMRTARPYRAALSVAAVRAEIEKGRGRQFDPKIVDALLTEAAWNRLLEALYRFDGVQPGDALEDEFAEQAIAVELQDTAAS